MKFFDNVFFLVQEQNVCGKTLPEYKRKHAYRGQYDEALNCPDGSDELCGDPCVQDGFTGRFTIKVCSWTPICLTDAYYPWFHYFKGE